MDRKRGYVQIGRLEQRIAPFTNLRLGRLMDRHLHLYQTVTFDNGCEFHGYKQIEQSSEVRFYFTTRTTRESAAPMKS